MEGEREIEKFSEKLTIGESTMFFVPSFKSLRFKIFPRKV